MQLLGPELAKSASVSALNFLRLASRAVVPCRFLPLHWLAGVPASRAVRLIAVVRGSGACRLVVMVTAGGCCRL